LSYRGKDLLLAVANCWQTITERWLNRI